MPYTEEVVFPYQSSGGKFTYHEGRMKFLAGYLNLMNIFLNLLFQHEKFRVIKMTVLWVWKSSALFV